MKKKNAIQELTSFDRLIDECTVMNEQDWDDFLSLHVQSLDEQDDMTEEDYWEERKYLIGYWDMGKFNEVTIRGFTEELAIDSFIANYKSPHGLQPYVARCETFYDYEKRIESGDNSLPEDGQFWRFEHFGNAYYEALNN